MSKPLDTPATWRVDCRILRSSRWHYLTAFLWSAVLLLVMGLANLLWWQWIFMIAITALTIWLYRHNHFSQVYPVVHITQPDFTELYEATWFLYIDAANDSLNEDDYNYNHNHHHNAQSQSSLQLWQGYLTSTYVNQYLVVLYFDIIEPLPRSMRVSIWRDQVDEKAWRQLQVMARC